MKTRILSAACLLPLFLLILLACPVWATAILVAAMAAVAVYELLYVTAIARYARVVAYTMIMAVFIVACSYFTIPLQWKYTAILVYCLSLVLELLKANTEMQFSAICVAAFSALAVPYALSALVRILSMENGRFLIIVSLILAFSSDTGAYFVGLKFGKHKLAPVISPKKTVEGLIGGVVSCMLFMIAYCLILQFAFKFKVNYIFAAIYGLVGSLASVVGDLTFSVVKRQTGIKDFGNLMPGHGGVLDRFDSTVVVAPLTELLLLLLPLVA